MTSTSRRPTPDGRHAPISRGRAARKRTSVINYTYPEVTPAWPRQADSHLQLGDLTSNAWLEGRKTAQLRHDRWRSCRNSAAFRIFEDISSSRCLSTTIGLR